MSKHVLHTPEASGGDCAFRRLGAVRQRALHRVGTACGFAVETRGSCREGPEEAGEEGRGGGHACVCHCVDGDAEEGD